MRLAIFLILSTLASITHAQNQSNMFMRFNDGAKATQKIAPSYITSKIAQDRAKLMTTYSKLAPAIRKKGASNEEIEDILISSLLEIRMLNPTGSFDLNAISDRASKYVKLVVNSVPTGAEVQVIDKNARRKGNHRTDTSFWVYPGKYLLQIKKDGFCDWKNEVGVFAGDPLVINASMSIISSDSDAPNKCK